MNKQQVTQIFRTEILPAIRQRYEQDGIIDKPARREAWNNFTDSLCKDREITQKQYDTWTYPFKL